MKTNQNQEALKGNSEKILFIPIFSVERYQILKNRKEASVSPPSDFFLKSHPAYLYCVLSKNRVTVNPKYVEFDDKNIYAEFFIENRDQILKEKVAFEHSYHNLKELKLVSEYPFNQFLIKDELGNDLIGQNSSYILERNLYNQVNNKLLLNYEILYVGQSVKDNNNVPALERTLNHKTIQEIREDYMDEHRDKEIFTLLFSFKKSNLLDFPDYVSDDDRLAFSTKFIPFWESPTKEQTNHLVNVVEASLINYFKPKYNDKFVRHSPSKFHSSFDALHDLNLSKVIFNFTLDDFDPILFSPKVARKKIYNIQFSF